MHTESKPSAKHQDFQREELARIILREIYDGTDVCGERKSESYSRIDNAKHHMDRERAPTFSRGKITEDLSERLHEFMALLHGVRRCAKRGCEFNLMLLFLRAPDIVGKT